MLFHPRPSSILLLTCAALFADATLAQSLSIVRKGETEFRIEGAAPAETRYALQGSGNLENWTDLNDEVWGQVAYTFNSVGVAHRFFRLIPWNPLPPITVVLIGDSTVADFVSNGSRYSGWGQGVYGYFKPEVRVVNLAIPGYGTKRFLASAERTTMLKIKPDFVFIGFGVVDAFYCGGEPEQCYATDQEFGDNLKAIVQSVRDFNGTPILVTPPVIKAFDGNGRVIPWVMAQCYVAKQVASEVRIDLIDLNQRSMDLFNELGEIGCAYIIEDYPGNIGHFSMEGARVMAGLVVDGFPKALRPYLAGDANPAQNP